MYVNSSIIHVGRRVRIMDNASNTVWEYIIDEDKAVHVIAVPNITRCYVKMDDSKQKYILIRELSVFGYFKQEVLNQYQWKLRYLDPCTTPTRRTQFKLV